MRKDYLTEGGQHILIDNNKQFYSTLKLIFCMFSLILMRENIVKTRIKTTNIKNLVSNTATIMLLHEIYMLFLKCFYCNSAVRPLYTIMLCSG